MRTLQNSEIICLFVDTNFAISQLKAEWKAKLDHITHENVDACTDRIRPRHALRALEEGLVPGSIVATDIGNICSVSNSYLKFKLVHSLILVNNVTL